MTHYAVLRHGFDIHQNPRRLGPPSAAPFWLGLGHGGAAPSWLVGNTIWLVSWEGMIKMRHMLWGWYVVAHVGTRASVAAQYFASGHDGQLFEPRGLDRLKRTPGSPSFARSSGHSAMASRSMFPIILPSSFRSLRPPASVLRATHGIM